eukprot:scaffold60339_cov38-Prasinocladus_malaysianus.AAC.2
MELHEGLCVMGEYLYGLDVGDCFVFEDLLSQGILQDQNKIEWLCARASQAFGMGAAHWSIDDFPDDTFMPLFRLKKPEFHAMYDALSFESFPTKLPNRSRVTPEECFLVWLRRMASRGTIFEVGTQTFSACPTRCSHMFNTFSSHLHDTWSERSLSIGIPMERAAEYADAIKNTSGTGMDNCICFLDTKALECSRPGGYLDQMSVYNGYYGYHCLRWQSTWCPDGMSYDFYGPVEGRRSDNYLLDASSFVDRFMGYHRRLGYPVCAYADAGYWCSTYVQTGFRSSLGERPPGSRNDIYSRFMNKCRTSVEWGFGLIGQNFPYCTIPAYARLGSTPLALHYRNAVFMTNCLTTLRGNITSKFFDCQPPSLGDYLTYVA